MVKNSIVAFLLSFIGMFVSIGAFAEEVKAPVLKLYNFQDNSCIQGFSDNGQWAVSYGPSPADGSQYTNSRLIHVKSGEITVLGLVDDETVPLSCIATDVSDGGLVVGGYKGRPAIWTKEKGWQNLENPTGWIDGKANAVTPDGHYAVGCMTDFSNGYKEYPVLWDLTTLRIVETPNYPVVGSNNETAQMVRYTGITSDGRFIMGIVDFSYTWNTLEFIYDRETRTWSRIGFNSDGTPWANGIYSVSGSFSPDGKWFGGSAYIVGKEIGDEYSLPCRYNFETKEFEVFDDSGVRDFSTVVIDNEGTLYASTPSGTPIRSLYIRAGQFWYALDELLKQHYGFDFYTKSGYDNTGTCIGVSGDGRILTCFPDPYESYTLELDESFADAASQVNLLGGYTSTPADGASFTKMRSVSVEFLRDVKILGDKSDIQFKDEDGLSVGKILSLELTTNSEKTVRIGFRTLSLEDGKKYTLTIPVGTIALKADETRVNDEIVLSYTGRAETPVKVVSVSPEGGSALSQLDVATNPVLFTFDTEVKVANESGVRLFREGDDNALASFSLVAKDNQVLAYPATTEYLYLNTNYKLVIDAGSVTDINGDNSNERYEVSYEGLYERIVVADDTLMYQEDFSEGIGNMLLYEGDHNVPTEEMMGYTFLNKDNYPWIPVRDDGVFDFAAASTSSYNPAGKSDDWMVTPRIFIPDGKCRLTFQAQGFRKAKQDRLKVIVYASEKVLNYLSANEVADMRANGEVVMDEIVSPGASEDVLAGDWTDYSFNLAKYAKQNIYVAFVNENEDQSLVFVDNIKVIRDNGFLAALTSPTTVVALSGQKISGRVIANTGTVISSVNVKLLDSNKTVVDEIAESGLALEKGDKYDFTFSKELPLTIGEVNSFYFRVQLDEMFDTVKYSVKDLAFQPEKRVVVEEMTGQGCPNCPLGHLAIENLEKLYGDKVIPISYHTYTGDNYESGMSDYVANFLGLSGAPSGKVNRSEMTAYPMYDNLSEGKHIFTYTSPSGDCWLDLVQKEFQVDADADLSIIATYDESVQEVSVPFNVRFAMNEEKQNIGLFLVVTEDGLKGYQSNKFYTCDPQQYEGLGDWAQGGKYGQSAVLYTHNEVARAHVGTSYYGTTGYIPSMIVGGEEYTGTISFALPPVNDIYNCKVVCMMIDANTGAVINAARADIKNAMDIDSITVQENVVVVGRYNLAGQPVSASQKGLCILKMSDGSAKKVLVK